MKQRRIGTLTLGIALIMIGIIIPTSLIFKDAALKIIQFSPLILIVLGVEILYFAIRYKEEKFRYDGLSIFLVLIITFTTIGASTISPLIDKGISYSQKQIEEHKLARKAIEDILIETGVSADVSIHQAYDFYGSFDYWLMDGKIAFEYQADLHIYKNKETTKEEIAKEIYQLIQKYNSIDTNIDRLNFYVEHQGGVYRIELSARRMKNITLDDISTEIRYRADETNTNEDTYYDENGESIDSIDPLEEETSVSSQNEF